MSRFQVYTEAAGGGDRVYLGSVGSVQALRYSTDVHGDLDATWQMRLDPRVDHRALHPGRTVGIPLGASTWQGTLGNPGRGDVWQFNAFGLSWSAKTYDAIAPTTGNALKLDEVVDAAISRGWNVTRPAALPALTAGQQGSGIGKVADSFNTVCDAKNQLWQITRARQVTAITRPTNTAYLLMANDTAGGRTVGGFVTDVHVTYTDSNSYAATTILRSSASRPYGRFEDPLDITDLGPITATQAQAHGDNWLAKQGARLQFTGAFSIASGQLLNPGGAAVDLGTVQALDGAVRVMLTDPDTAAGELALGAITLPVGETDYDVDSDTLSITPLDISRTGLAAVFA